MRLMGAVLLFVTAFGIWVALTPQAHQDYVSVWPLGVPNAQAAAP